MINRIGQTAAFVLNAVREQITPTKVAVTAAAAGLLGVAHIFSNEVLAFADAQAINALNLAGRLIENLPQYNREQLATIKACALAAAGLGTIYVVTRRYMQGNGPAIAAPPINANDDDSSSRRTTRSMTQGVNAVAGVAVPQ